MQNICNRKQKTDKFISSHTRPTKIHFSRCSEFFRNTRTRIMADSDSDSDKEPTNVKRNPVGYEENKRSAVGNYITSTFPAILEKMSWGTKEVFLDHGCGGGSTTFDFILPQAVKTDSTIVAIDNCPEMIDHSQDNYPHERIEYVFGNWEAVKDKKFNKIFSFFTLPFVADHRDEIENLGNLLVPGGEMYIVCLLESHKYELFQQIRDMDKWDDLAEEHLIIPEWLNQTESPADVVRGDFLELGFEILFFTVDENETKFANPHVVADMLLALNGFAHELEPNLHAELKETYRKIHHQLETKTHKPGENTENSEYIMHSKVMQALVRKP